MSDEKTKLKSVAWWATALLPSIILAVGSWFTAQWWQADENRPRYLDFRIDRVDAMIPKPETGGAEMVVNIDDYQVDNLSNVTLTVMNNEDMDFHEATLIVTIKADTESPVRLINGRITHGVNRTELIPNTLAQDEKISISPEIDEVTEQRKDTVQHSRQIMEAIQSDKEFDRYVKKLKGTTEDIVFEYKLKSINRADDASFQAEYLFAGDKSPDIDVEVVATSLTGRELERTDYSNMVLIPKWSAAILLFAGIIVVLVFIIGVAEVLITKIRQWRTGNSSVTNDHN